MNGGYSLIDFFDVNITSEPVKIEGIFKKYQASKRKAFLLSNVTINNTQLNDVFSTSYFEDGKVCFPAYDGVIKISDTDYVNFDVTADVIADMYLSKEEFLSIESDNTPYVSRTARDGLVKIPQLVGGTVAWNQLIPTRINTTESNSYPFTQGTRIVAGHKYLYSAKFENNTQVASVTIYIGKSSNQSEVVAKLIRSMESPILIFSAAKSGISDGTTTLSEGNFWVYTYVVSANNTISDVNLIDLTQMFGTAIADYVYSLEQSVEGSGIAWLKSYGFFTKDYYAYDAGSLQSVCTSGRKITALDGTVRTYPIDSEELRGLFKLDANNKLYADGDVYQSNGSGTRKYGILDLGDCDWNYRSEYNCFAVTNPCIYKLSNNAQAIAEKYVFYGTVDGAVGMANKPDKTFCFYFLEGSNNRYIYIKDSAYTDAASFKSAMSGVYLVYELATPTTFSADPYINPQRSEGTEEFVDGLTRDVMIPVGNNSTYYKDELFNIIGEYIDSCDDAVIAMIPEGE